MSHPRWVLRTRLGLLQEKYGLLITEPWLYALKEEILSFVLQMRKLERTEI